MDHAQTQHRPVEDHFQDMAGALSKQIAETMPGSAVLVVIAASRPLGDGDTLASPSGASLANRHLGAQACACIDAVVCQLRDYIDTVAVTIGIDPAVLRRDLLQGETDAD